MYAFFHSHYGTVNSKTMLAIHARFFDSGFYSKDNQCGKRYFSREIDNCKKSAGQCPSVYNTVQNYVSRRLRRKRTRGNPIFGIAKLDNNFLAKSVWKYFVFVLLLNRLVFIVPIRGKPSPPPPGLSRKTTLLNLP